jgi:AcrR family transcriptional regulator
MAGTSAEASPDRKRLSAAARRAQIVAAAREVFIEQGMNGTRSREIAERAGITEAYLYRHFHSKEEIYRLAVDAPLTELIDKLRRETHELAERSDVPRSDVLFRCHELFLGCMVEIAPLVAAALFSNPDPRREFYADYLFPHLRNVLEVIIPDITGFPLRAFEVDVFVEAMIGIHLTLALEYLMDNKPVDVPGVALQITEMFAPGVGRGRKKASTGSTSPDGRRVPSEPASSSKKPAARKRSTRR